MIPLAPNRISVTRTTFLGNLDPYDSSPVTGAVASNVRAVVGTPAANAALSGGDRVVYTARLVCDPIPIEVGDQVTDEQGRAWTALWVAQFAELGTAHTLCELRLVQGAT